jgi:hypothetical protein
MYDFEVIIKLYKKFQDEANRIVDKFENLSEQCKFQKIWTDPFDGEMIPKCYKIGKGKPKRDRMECTIESCPLK